MGLTISTSVLAFVDSDITPRIGEVKYAEVLNNCREVLVFIYMVCFKSTMSNEFKDKL